MIEYIICAIIIILIIIVIYNVFYSDKSKRKKAEKLIQDSAGIFDESAQQALAEIDTIDDPNADDYFRRGYILQRNLLQNDVRSDNDPHQTILKNVVRDYTTTLMTLRNQRDDPVTDTNFIVDQIGDFQRNINEANDENDWEDQELILAMLEFNHATINIPIVKQDIINTRLQEAIGKSETRRELIDNYLDSNIVYTNDNQNVHDSKVNSDLKKTLAKLRSTYNNSNPKKSLKEAEDYIRQKYSREQSYQKVDAALGILSKIREGELISTFGDTEDHIFSYVWERCKLAQNADKKDLMREAIVNALADSIHNGTQVCINGRCSRVLNSLALLDYDPDVAAGAMTFEAYRNQIFQETKEIVNQEIDRAVASGGDMARVGQAYETGDDSGLPQLEAQFKSEIKSAIDNNLAQYNDKFSEAELHSIREQCYIIGTI